MVVKSCHKNIKITTTHSQLGTSQLNAGDGQAINILSGASCGGGENGFNWQIWIIVGGFALAIGVFVYLVFIRKRRR